MKPENFKRILFAISLAAAFSLFTCRAAAQELPHTIEMVPMRDGVKLATDIYLPEGEGPWPAILVRTPYSRGAMRGIMKSCLEWGGYACVAQDVRGRFDSEGRAVVFTTETEDGYDTVEWIASQKWSGGSVGTTGGSAMGITQYAMLREPSPHLKCQFVEVAAPFLFSEVRAGGGFRLALVEGWLALSMFKAVNLVEYYSHETLDDFWRNVDNLKAVGDVKIPIFHEAGWYDIFVEGGLKAFAELNERGGEGARGRQKMRIGPWTHMTFNKAEQAELTFPPSVKEQTSDPKAWFEWCLKGEDTGVEEWPEVRFYMMGDVDDPAAPGNAWKTTDKWPPKSDATKFYLHKSGEISNNKSESEDAAVDAAFDPRHPVPTRGGRNLIIPAGPYDQNAIGAAIGGRADVLTFQTAPLEEPVEIAGEVLVNLFVSADVPDTDITAKLMDVYPDGRAMLLLQGVQRMKYRNSQSAPEPMTPGEVYEITFSIGNTAIAFNRGHRIRVDVSGSNFPFYDVNSNTGEQRKVTLASAQRRLNMARVHKWVGIGKGDKSQLANVKIYLSGDRPSGVVLPVVE
ncbi:MAG: CocE/NonD family hydrolase [bacterium]